MSKRLVLPFLLSFLAPINALPATIITNTLVDTGDLTYDGQDLVVSNCTLTINGPHAFNSVLAESNAILTHSGAPNGETNHCMLLDVAGDFTVDASSAVDVHGRGYQSDAGPGAGGHDCQGLGFSGGGGYGGLGGNFAGNSGYCYVTGGATYGSESQPTDWGSGSGNACGGNCSGGPGYGGGRMRLTIGGTLRVDGIVSADGLTCAVACCGGGAGGSIWIIAPAIAGTGIISANGGNTWNRGPGWHNGWFGSGGGGGRIAINSASTNQFVGFVTVDGGAGGGDVFGDIALPGEAGTIYWASAVTPPVTLPLLVQPVCNGTNFGFSFQTVSNAGYVIQSCGGLGSAGWVPLQTMIGNGGTMTYSIPMTNTGSQFFRVRQQ